MRTLPSSICPFPFPSKTSFRLMPESIPGDWYVHLFDKTYLEIDQIRRPPEATRAEIRWIERLADSSRPLHILDLACGYGRHAIELAKRGHAVVGIDLSATLLNKAEMDAKKAGVHIQLLQQDIRQLPDERFDLAISMHTSLGYFETPAENSRFVSRIKEVLSEEGIFIFDQLDTSHQAIRQAQAYEHYLLNADVTYQKISFFREKQHLWYGAYLYDSNTERTFAPFRIWIQQDSVGKSRGIYHFSDGR